MIRKTVLAAGQLFLVLGLVAIATPSAQAAPYELADSVPLLMIDGDGDRNSSVSVLVGGRGARRYDFGMMVNGQFELITPSRLGYARFQGGEVVDFAIRDSRTGTVQALSDGDARMTFSGRIDANRSANPVVSDDYWAATVIHWNSGPREFILSLRPYSGDGVAPHFAGSIGQGAPIPEPATVLLLGVGAIGLAAGRRRRRA
ncbi:MAG: PEP-CTERM sorting domain-containing protein [Planctomycetota bacterium]